MKLIFQYMKRCWQRILAGMSLKLVATMTELLLPYILEHIIDDLVPLKQMDRILTWGLLMVVTAFATWRLNIWANRIAVDNAHRISYDVRKDLFERTLDLSGPQADAIGLPSLISRMTSDSYNIQSFAQSFQTMFVRSPITMIGGIIITLTMDRALAAILCVTVPLLLVAVIFVSMLSIPLYNRVQESLDDIVRIMRENITGIRVVKALSKTDYEVSRFQNANVRMRENDVKAGTVLAVPGPFMQMCLNIGLALVIYFGAQRVDAGLAQPGVILAFLTYFNMILQGVMGLNRIFTMMSKASASAARISEVIQMEEEQPVLLPEQGEKDPGGAFVRFEHVSFNYGKTGENKAGDGFAGKEREQCLEDISFAIKKGEGLGIIGPTGCGKTTIINLLLRFYDTDEGGVFVDGKDVRTWEKDELRRKFGIVMQNDVVFHDTIRENISFGRDIDDPEIRFAAGNAMAADFVDHLPGTYEFAVDMKGANLSGGQKQRLMIARALAARPEILILDDSSSALDYQTDAALRKALQKHYSDTTMIMVAQRVSSIRHMTNILVLDNGRCLGYGSHEELLKSCSAYREIYESQMGELA